MAFSAGHTNRGLTRSSTGRGWLCGSLFFQSATGSVELIPDDRSLRRINECNGDFSPAFSPYAETMVSNQVG